jgi:hypothetical protein
MYLEEIPWEYCPDPRCCFGYTHDCSFLNEKGNHIKCLCDATSNIAGANRLRFKKDHVLALVWEEQVIRDESNFVSFLHDVIHQPITGVDLGTC